MSINYWSPTIREALHQGRISIDQDDLLAAYREWRDMAVVLTFCKEGEDDVEIIGPKRGNRPYARKKRRRYRGLQAGMNGLVWDYDVQGVRRRVMRKTHLLFITCTFDHKLYARQESWRLCTSRGGELNLFSAKLHKVIGNKATYKAKESQSSGHAAPHILCIMDRPVTTIYHNGVWRVQNRRIVEAIKSSWPHGFVDVRACVGGKVRGMGVMGYVMKYQTKTSDSDYLSPKQLRISELTHAWNKIYGTRDVVSKQFLDRLNMLHVPPVEDMGPSGWELCDIDYQPDLIMIAQRAGIGVPVAS